MQKKKIQVKYYGSSWQSIQVIQNHLSQFTFIFVCVKIAPIDFDHCNPLSGTNMLQFLDRDQYAAIFGHCLLSMSSEGILNFILLVKKAKASSNVWSNAQQIFSMKIFHSFKPSIFALTKKLNDYENLVKSWSNDHRTLQNFYYVFYALDLTMM